MTIFEGARMRGRRLVAYEAYSPLTIGFGTKEQPSMRNAYEYRCAEYEKNGALSVLLEFAMDDER